MTVPLKPSPQTRLEYVEVPMEPTEKMWGGLARAIMMWIDMSAGGPKTPRALLEHLKMSGHATPQWLRDEPEMLHLDHSISKGTRCVLIYKAMLSAAIAARKEEG